MTYWVILWFCAASEFQGPGCQPSHATKSPIFCREIRCMTAPGDYVIHFKRCCALEVIAHDKYRYKTEYLGFLINCVSAPYISRVHPAFHYASYFIFDTVFDTKVDKFVRFIELFPDVQ